MNRRKFLGGTAAVAVSAVVAKEYNMYEVQDMIADEVHWSEYSEFNPAVADKFTINEFGKTVSVQEISTTQRWVKGDRVPAHIRQGWVHVYSHDAATRVRIGVGKDAYLMHIPVDKYLEERLYN